MLARCSRSGVAIGRSLTVAHCQHCLCCICICICFNLILHRLAARRSEWKAASCEKKRQKKKLSFEQTLVEPHKLRSKRKNDARFFRQLAAPFPFELGSPLKALTRLAHIQLPSFQLNFSNHQLPLKKKQTQTQLNSTQLYAFHLDFSFSNLFLWILSMRMIVIVKIQHPSRTDELKTRIKRSELLFSLLPIGSPVFQWPVSERLWIHNLKQTGFLHPRWLCFCCGMHTPHQTQVPNNNRSPGHWRTATLIL